MKRTEDHIYKFNSPFEFIDYLGEPGEFEESAAVSEQRTEFTGTETYEDAKKIAFEGFEVSDVIATLSELEKTFESQEIAVQHDVQGSFVDVGAYMTGEPECMIDFAEIERPNSSIKFVMNASEAYEVTSQQILNRGACLAGVVDCLQKKGVPSEVFLSIPMRGINTAGKPDFMVLIKIKEASESLNLNLLTGVLHPSLLRRIYFNFVEKTYQAEARRNYGIPITDEEDLNKLLKKAGVEDLENVIQVKTVTQLGYKFAFKTFDSIKAYAELLIEDAELKLNI